MDTEQNPKLEFRIAQTNTLLEMEKDTNKLLADGWQKASEVKTFCDSTANIFGARVFYQEFIRKMPEELPKYDETAFVKAYMALDQRVRDLLEINNVGFGFEDGQPCTYFGEEKIAGFMSPATVLARLKNSGHLPLDLDDYAFVTELGKLLCAY